MNSLLSISACLVFLSPDFVTAYYDWDRYYQYRGELIFEEEFDTFNTSRWQHIITAWRNNNEFQYYTDRAENRYALVLLTFLVSCPLFTHVCITVLRPSVCSFFYCSYAKDGTLFIKPTLTADRFGEDFLYDGVLDLNPEGCNVNYRGGCIA